MAGQAFQFGEDDPAVRGARRHGHAGDLLDRLAIGQAVGQRFVAGNPFGKIIAAFQALAFAELFKALVHKIELCLEVDDRFAGDAEAEVPRFDDAGVHRPDRDLVNAFAFDAGEADRLLRARRPAAPVEVAAQGVLPGRPIAVEDQRLGVRMAIRPQAEQVMDLPLVQGGGMDGGADRRENRIRRVDGRPQGQQLPQRPVGECVAEGELFQPLPFIDGK